MYKLTKCPATNKLACWFSWLDHCTWVLKRSRVLILYKPGFSQAFFLKLHKKKAMILFTSLIGDKTKTKEGFACRQYCFGLLGLISAVLMLAWRLSYKATPNDSKKLMWYHLSHSRVLQLANYYIYNYIYFLFWNLTIINVTCKQRNVLYLG